ncbi:Tumor necrosis factor receptor superfamily member 14 [Myotis brandtii]|uniref:Tumor necrosis factor receptor superfamily member 14 n=1 Tax=Myotis brandtii TaxID=109478 RepID=S7PIY8_MYOBR|nr:Tumor necrosis factor receptor superfamily member 14 [Myotis brandtii]
MAGWSRCVGWDRSSPVWGGPPVGVGGNRSQDQFVLFLFGRSHSSCEVKNEPVCPAGRLSCRPESRGRGQGMRVPGVVMHPLPGWGPPPCSPTPTADFLRLALSLLLLTALPCALGQPLCKEGEFQKGALCCPKCWPGYRVQEACGEFRGTMCVACTPGTYTAHLNGLPECLPCRVCDPGTSGATLPVQDQALLLTAWAGSVEIGVWKEP